VQWHVLTCSQRTVDLAGMRTSTPTESPTALELHNHDETSSKDETCSRDDSYTSVQQSREARRKGTGGLRVSQTQSSFQEDLTEHQRQMQVDSRSFPKRKKVRLGFHWELAGRYVICNYTRRLTPPFLC
jgi:ATP-dependent RNA helicase DDX49/DBP8